MSGAQSDLDLRLLRYFAVVVDLGSITMAARALVMTQPALSRSMRSLERQMGVDLLVRSVRGVEPTPAGRTLYRHVTTLRAQASTAVTEVRASTAPTTLPVTVVDLGGATAAAGGGTLRH
ncbi:LysR family transcriptional regulator [Actinomycetospora sp. OC33-EN08]|uniref:LysR family transcriptional regulator n=1 Tax=Actinomycetospora aurantiaca TaxID=3129233 RepID=A0ABU8MT99_9PSEU